MDGSKAWLVPLTGAAGIVIAIVSIVVLGDDVNPKDDSIQEIVDFYKDNGDQVAVSSGLSVLAATLLVFFYGHVRQLFRSAAGEASLLPSVILAGAVAFASGVALDSALLFATSEAADNADPVATETLNAFYSNDFFVFVLGAQVILLAAGIAIVRNEGVLPKWLGWVAIVLGVVAVTPIGFASFVGFLLFTPRGEHHADAEGESRLIDERGRVAGTRPAPGSGTEIRLKSGLSTRIS